MVLSLNINFINYIDKITTCKPKKNSDYEDTICRSTYLYENLKTNKES